MYTQKFTANHNQYKSYLCVSIHYAPSKILSAYFLSYPYMFVGRAVAQLVAALCYKSEGCGFDSRWSD
jgi:hypothetical protein